MWYRVAFGSYFRHNCSLEEHVQRQRANGIAELAMKADGCIERWIFLIVVIYLLILLWALNPYYDRRVVLGIGVKWKQRQGQDNTRSNTADRHELLHVAVARSHIGTCKSTLYTRICLSHWRPRCNQYANRAFLRKATKWGDGWAESEWRQNRARGQIWSINDGVYFTNQEHNPKSVPKTTPITLCLLLGLIPLELSWLFHDGIEKEDT